MSEVKTTEVAITKLLKMKTNEMVNKENKQQKTLGFWIPMKRNNKINVAPKSKSSKKSICFQECMKATLVVGQFFSLIPVSGILAQNSDKVKFSWKSLKTVYSIISVLGQIYMTIMSSLIVARGVNLSLKPTSTIIFYSTTVITMLIFVHIAKRWPCLVQHIAKLEEVDPNFDERLKTRCNVTCFVVLILALFEHILSLIKAFSMALNCLPDTALYEAFVKCFYSWVFDFLPYSPILGIVTQFLHFQSTFIWNFSDLFVICMSYYLTSRLEQVNKKLLAVQGKYLPELFWRTSREDYVRSTQLVRKVDDVISGIIFISFANNLFFICLQLFNTLEDGIKGSGGCANPKAALDKSQILGGFEAATYFLFSLVFLIARSIAVSLIASQVNSATTVPAPILYDVPSPVYCVEVQRFLDQVNGEKVALSGLQFFNVTRGLLLTVAGTIVTYELVMFQFNSSPGSPPTVNTTVTPTTTASS